MTHSCRFNNVDQLELEWTPSLRSHRRYVSNTQDSVSGQCGAGNFMHIQNLSGRSRCTEESCAQQKLHTGDLMKNDVFKHSDLCTNTQAYRICSLDLSSTSSLQKNQAVRIYLKTLFFFLHPVMCVYVCVLVCVCVFLSAGDNPDFYGEDRGEAGRGRRYRQ